MDTSKLIDRLGKVIREKQLSSSTEKAYVSWVCRFITFHKHKHLAEMGCDEIKAFVKHQAIEKRASVSTQNQAIDALNFVYKNVLKTTTEHICVKHIPVGRRHPIVFTCEEAQNILSKLHGECHLMASLLYGSGLRLSECMQLRVRDI